MHVRIWTFLGLIGATFFVVLGQSFNFEKQTIRVEKNERKILSVEEEQKKSWIDEKLTEMSLRQKIGQFFMVATYSNKGEDHFRSIDSLILNEEIGGLIFFQGERENLLNSIERFQNETKIPLLIGMDAEWGVSMRLFGEKRFPYNYTLGAANEPKLTEKIAMMMGQECRELGIHLNFAPVADVNSNPNNPIIGFRSFGESPKEVASHVTASVKGMERQSVMTSIKHFPGHGDTDVDSHKDLPVINNAYKHINAIDFFPFRAGVLAGASTVMIGHLDVPALDPSGTPASLSRVIIQDYLKGELGFNGIVVSDALGMKAVANKYGETEVVVKAFQAGCDILLFPKSVKEAIDAIEEKVKRGEISAKEIDERCRKILSAKYNYVVQPERIKSFSKGEVEWTKKEVYEKAITVLRNEDDFLPIKRFDQKILHVSIGLYDTPMVASMNLVHKVDYLHFFTGEEAMRRIGDKLDDYDIVLTSIHAKRVSKRGDYGMPKGWRNWLKNLPSEKKCNLTLLGNPNVLSKDVDLSKLKSIVIAYENNDLANERVGQFLMGTFGSRGKLPVYLNEEFKRGFGLKIESGGRLKESQPEEFGIDPDKMSEIDSIVVRGIKNGAFPGCQIVVAVKGSVIYRKSFGNQTYDSILPIKNSDVYDIASITKIASSTLSLMHYQTRNEFNLDMRLGDVIPEITQNTPYNSLQFRKVLAHQAGLKPWIPFYLKTLDNWQLRSDIYAKDSTEKFNTPVAKNVWILGSYTDSIYARILATPLRNSKKYKYSDLGYYFIKRIIEKKSGMPLNDFVTKTFYEPMGLDNMRYLPRNYFSMKRIVPTEYDTIFRKTLIHGYVHDQGAAMMGGVGGHAGLFSNAGDLAQLMQLFILNGKLGGVQYLSPQVVREYTSCQYCPKNRRGAGFDKPTRNLDGGPTCDLVSLNSFGHSGFTGTIAWADPKNQVNYVFLSNRVYPDAENWKLIKMNIRTDIQRVIYEAISSAKKM